MTPAQVEEYLHWVANDVGGRYVEHSPSGTEFLVSVEVLEDD